MVDTLKNITIIILLVIYIPVIILIVLNWKKKKIKLLLLPLAIISLPLLYFVIFSTLPYYELMSFHGKVIDANTKQPIGGAAVLAVYYDEAVTIAGTNRFPIDAQETLTDEKGEFKIAEVKEWFGDRPGTVVEADLIIFKPGYGVFPRHKDARMVGIGKGWPASGKYVVYELPKLKTRQERKANLHFQYYEGLGNKKFLNFLILINEEYKNLGLPGISIPKKDK